MFRLSRTLLLLALAGELANGQEQKQQQPPSLPPPAEFVRDFMVSEECYGLVFHSDINDVRNVFIEYRILSPFDFTPISALDVEYPEIIKPEKHLTTDLHVVPDLGKYLQFLIGHFDKRPRTDTDPWLINIKDISSARDMLDGIKMDIDDLVYLYIGDNAGKFFEIFEAYKISPEWSATILPYGTWSMEFGLNVTDVNIWQRRRDFQGLRLKVATLYSKPYITRMDQINDTDWVMEGMFTDVFHTLQEVLNFTYTLAPPPDRQWGADKGNNVWTGMVGLLATQKIDIAATDFTITHERSAVMTFGEPITQIYHKLFIKNPSGRPNYTAYLEPFHYLSWIGLVCMIIATPPLVYLAVSYGAYDLNHREFTLAKSYVFGAGMLTFARPWERLPYTVSARIAFMSIMFGGTFIFWHWEAMLISYLATRVITLPFTSLEGLIKDSDFKITLTPGSSYADSYKFSQIPLWQEAWKTRIEPYIDTYPDGEGHAFKIMAETDYAAYDNFFAVRSYDAYSACEIIDIPKRYDFKPYAYGFQKYSPYLGPFNYYLRQMREKGATKKILDEHEPQPQVCPDFSGKPLGLESCFTAFLILIAGLIASPFVLLFEAMIKSCSKSFGAQYFDFIDSYGRSYEIHHSPSEEEKQVFEDSSVDDMVKLILQQKNWKISELIHQKQGGDPGEVRRKQPGQSKTFNWLLNNY